LPFQRHQCLVDRIMLDDPDNFAGAYQAGEEKHGADNEAQRNRHRDTFTAERSTESRGRRR